ncbi:MAG: amino acid ABC transporter permease [Treponema sp.]|nr:amino acid ABC transporter permease [Treponema sp.]
MGEFFSWQRVWENFPRLIVKLPITFEIVIIAFAVGCTLGIIISFIELKRLPVLTQILHVFISFERGTPLLVQMLVMYYGLPLVLQALFGIDSRGWEKLTFVIITYTLNQAAFLSQDFRGAIISIPVGQREAALACGLSPVQASVRIILPQAIQVAVPSVGLELIGLFQDTSLVCMVGVIDIVGRAQSLGNLTSHTFESYLIVAFVFVVISLALTGINSLINRRLGLTGALRRKDGGEK